MGGRSWMKLGLSDNVRLVEGGAEGHRLAGERLTCLGAGDGVPWRGGSSASRGPPLCARKATERKNGVRVSPIRRITERARAA